MSITTEILTLQHIRVDLALKIADMQNVIGKVKASHPDHEQIALTEKVLRDLQELYAATTHELQTNSLYTRLCPALCAIGMPEDVKTALLGRKVGDEADTEGENIA